MSDQSLPVIPLPSGWTKSVKTAVLHVISVKKARLTKIDPRRRPHYPAVERVAILELKAARGWSLAQAARAFLVEPDTIASWLRRIDEDGSSALVQLRDPVNKFPDFVRYIVQRLKALCPALGKV